MLQSVRTTFLDRPLISSSDTDKARLAGRLTIYFVLQLIDRQRELYQGNLMLMVIHHAIMAANVRHLDAHLENDKSFQAVDDIVPDSHRIPTSVKAISTTLALPYETTRRYINTLESMGLCRKVGGGVIAPQAIFDNEASKQSNLNNLGDLRQFIATLKAAGIEL